MTAFSFEGPSSLWQSFFAHATINFGIKHILVEQREKELFTSACIEGVRHTWATVEAPGFKLEGEGEFVVATDTIKKCLNIMKGGMNYIGTVKKNKLIIEADNNTQRTTIALGSIKKYKNSGESSYVVPNKHAADERYQISLVKRAKKPPVPQLPPKNGKASKGAWEQLVSITAGQLTGKLKDAKTIGSKTFVIKTEKDNPLLVTIKLAQDTTTGAIPIANEEEIEIAAGKVVHDWEASFISAYLDPIFQLVHPQAYIAMTDRGVGPKERNPGLWLVNYHMDDNKAQVIAGFLINPTNKGDK